jgi:hypothetical protein
VSEYVKPIEDGTPLTFEQFVWRCARAFSPLAEMREAPMDAPIPEKIEPGDYHRLEAERARVRLAEVEEWSDADAEKAAQAEYDEIERRREEAIAERWATLERYDAVIEQAEAWQPPTPEHEPLREFMLKTLRENRRYIENRNWAEPVLHTPREYRAMMMRKHASEVAYHEEKHAEDVEVARQRTAWLAALRESFEQQPAGV